MSIQSRIVTRSIEFLSGSTFNFRKPKSPIRATQPVTFSDAGPSSHTLLMVHQLRKALSAIKPPGVRNGAGIEAKPASVISQPPLDFSSDQPTRLRSVEEINTAATSFLHNGPAWNGSTATVPWSGLGSTAAGSIQGSYDGSNGEQALTFEVDQEGIHGQDDLKILVKDAIGDTIEEIEIVKEDPLNQVYLLANGLEFTLGEGDLVKNDTFEVDLSIATTSFAPAEPDWNGSTAVPSIGGAYDGSSGTGDLTFVVNQAGTHGTDDLKLDVYDPGDNKIESIDIDKDDSINQQYTLANGLTLNLGAGDLIKDETFKVAVDAADPSNFPTAPHWILSSATASVSGDYDGSNGIGSLTFEILDNGVHGEDDVSVRVFHPDGSTLQDIDINKDDPVSQGYLLDNGLTVTFAAGDFIKGETFAVDVETTASFSTDPNPVQSTAQPVIRGTYNGAQNTDTLIFTVSGEGSHGTDDLVFDVHTSDGTFLESINILSSDPLDQVYSLANGLTIQLGTGVLSLDESFTVDVNHTVPTAVNPDVSFNGIGVNDPRLEDGFTISDGSFEINGNTINVFATDSIQSVLDRVNNAGIDIAASFDAASERIILARESMGAENDIVVNNDTSGFLDAMKLSSALSVSGSGDETTRLANLDAMSGVSSGNLLVNGVSIALDVNADSLEDILQRIDALVANVDAEFDPDTNRVSIESTDNLELTLSSGGTGFFQAISIGEGTYHSVEGGQESNRNALTLSYRRGTARAIGQFARRFNAIFEDSPLNRMDPALNGIREELRAAISDVFESNGSKLDSDIGIGFDFSGDREEIIHFSSTEKNRFNNSLKTDFGATEFRQLFFGETVQPQSLVERLYEITKSAERELSIELAGRGRLIDTYA